MIGWIKPTVVIKGTTTETGGIDFNITPREFLELIKTFTPIFTVTYDLHSRVDMYYVISYTVSDTASGGLYIKFQDTSEAIAESMDSHYLKDEEGVS